MASKYTVAAQLYSMRDFLKEPKDMAKTMAKLKKIGYDAAQISGVGPIDPAELRRIMLGAGVQPIGAHMGLQAWREDEKKVLATCKAWGVNYVAIPYLPHDDIKTLAQWKAVFREMDGYARRAAKEGIVVQYHNHMFEFEKVGVKKGKGGKCLLDILYETAKCLQSEIDFGWVARGGNDVVAWAKKMAGRMDQVHLKDWGVRNNDPVWRAIGEGGINWPAVIKAAKAGGTRFFIVEQDECPMSGDPFVSFAVSRANLKAMGL